MKKTATLILLFCLCLTVTGYHLVYRFQVRAAKTEMKKRLQHPDNRHVVELRLAGEEAARLDWEDGYEFRFRGQMYDLISRHTEGKQEIIRCIPDEKETALLKSFLKNAPPFGKGHQPIAYLIQLITTQFISPSALLPGRPCHNITTRFPDHTAAVSSSTGTVLTPPPRSC